MKKVKLFEKFIETKVTESSEETGLMVIGRTSADNNKIGDIADDLGYHAEWNHREGYWLFPEEEDMYDELEAELEKAFTKKKVNARFEGIFESVVSEVNRSFVSGTSGRTLDSLEARKYELKKDVKGARIGDFTNVTLPKGTIIHNLPGGVFADHFSLKQKYTSKYSSQAPQWNDKFGVMVRSMPETLKDIEDNSKVLESIVTEKVQKIACLECDEVNTRKAWEKNNGFCPSCKDSSRGVTEANRGKVHKAAKQGSFPAVVVVVQDGKVIHQEPVSTPEVAPATFNVMQEKYPKATIHLEDKTGQRLFTESVVNEAVNIKKVINLVADLGWDYDRMSSSGQDVYDELCDLLNIK